MPMLGHVTGDLATAGGVPDMNGIAQIQGRGEFGDVGRVGVHLVAGPGLARTTMPAAVVGDDPVAML